MASVEAALNRALQAALDAFLAEVEQSGIEPRGVFIVRAEEVILAGSVDGTGGNKSVEQLFAEMERMLRERRAEGLESQHSLRPYQRRRRR